MLRLQVRHTYTITIQYLSATSKYGLLFAQYVSVRGFKYRVFFFFFRVDDMSYIETHFVTPICRHSEGTAGYSEYWEKMCNEVSLERTGSPILSSKVYHNFKLCLYWFISKLSSFSQDLSAPSPTNQFRYQLGHARVHHLEAYWTNSRSKGHFCVKWYIVSKWPIMEIQFLHFSVIG